METVRTVAELRSTVAAWRAEGARVALTPTMGALHAGHLSLVDLAFESADRVVASVFVNPAQFGADEDLESYPNDEAADAALLVERGCNLLYAPTEAEMYPGGFSTEVRVPGLTEVLCGAARPGHFDGVAVIVAKLLIQAQADVAVFGEKDWQQLTVVRRLVRDLDLQTEIVGAPTVRESDGLAMSSRNRYLTAEERAIAPKLHETLQRVVACVTGGVAAVEALDDGHRRLAAAGFGQVDYLEIRHPETLDASTIYDPEAPARVFAAAHLGAARLIDNLPVAP